VAISSESSEIRPAVLYRDMLGRHSQLTRCFSAVAEFLVYSPSMSFTVNKDVCKLCISINSAAIT